MLLPTGEWSGVVFTGAEEEKGTFLWHLAETGSAGTRQFTQYMKKGEATGDYAGIPCEDLVSDVKLLHSINVVRG